MIACGQARRRPAGRRLGPLDPRLRPARGAAGCADVLLSHGGHAAAAGFRVAASRIDAFREQFCAYAAANFPDGPPAPTPRPRRRGAAELLTLGLLKRNRPAGTLRAREPAAALPGRRPGDRGRAAAHGRRRAAPELPRQAGGSTMRAVAFGMGERVEELMSEAAAAAWPSRRSSTSGTATAASRSRSPISNPASRQS